MKLGLSEKSVLVMAASKGIGLACAQGFYAEGANVTICGRNKTSLDAAAKTMPGCLTVTGDVTNPKDIAAIVAQAAEKFGGIDVLVNNAGGPPAGKYEDLEDAAWEKAVNLTLMSAVRTTNAVIPFMRKAGGGRIVNISSFGVKQPILGLSLSNSVRMAVLGWAKTLASQVAEYNILVNTVCPGWTRTGRVTSLLETKAEEGGTSSDDVAANIATQIPLGRIGEPEEVANLAVFLGSSAASYMTGTAIQVDGGIVQGYA